MDHPVVLVTSLPNHQHAPLIEALQEASLPHISVSRKDLSDWLTDNLPRAILVGPDEEVLTDVCDTVRSNMKMSLVPIVWLTEQISGISFEKAFASGADDVALASHAEGIVRRLRLVPAEPKVMQAADRGSVLVVDPEQNRRKLLGRTLHNAGFSVRFALTLEEASRDMDEEVTAILAAAELDSDAIGMAIEVAHKKGIEAPWLISTPPKRMVEMSEHLEKHQPAVVYDGYAPVENVLFVLNDTLSSFVAEGRSSPRLLYGAPVFFRRAGIERAEIGYTYNISEGGLYVRTLLPLNPTDEAWLEVQPPRSPRPVRIDAKVVWTRKHGATKLAAVPPGFGVTITGGSEVDMQMYTKGYRAFLEDLSNVRKSIRPQSVPDPSVLPIQ